MKRTGLLLGLLLASCGDIGDSGDSGDSGDGQWTHTETMPAMVRFHVELDQKVYFPEVAVYSYKEPGKLARCIHVSQTETGWHSSEAHFVCPDYGFSIEESERNASGGFRDDRLVIEPVDFDGYWFRPFGIEFPWHDGTGLALPPLVPHLPSD
jgi:hypothetical protein